MEEHSGQRNTLINNAIEHNDILIVIKGIRLMIWYSRRVFSDALVKLYNKESQTKIKSIDDPQFQKVMPNT